METQPHPSGGSSSVNCEFYLQLGGALIALLSHALCLICKRKRKVPRKREFHPCQRAAAVDAMETLRDALLLTGLRRLCENIGVPACIYPWGWPPVLQW